MKSKLALIVMLKNLLLLNIIGSNLIFLIARAGPLDTLVDYAAQNGSMVSTNAPAITIDQQGGYLTGGSMLIRGPKPKNLEPFNIQMPKFKFDACTGSADFLFGGLSFISSEEFTRFLKSMSTAAGAYGVKMLLKTACPHCEDIMSYLETVARSVNEFSMDQCAMGQAIAQGAYNMISNGNKQKCLMQAGMNSNTQDMAEAISKCNTNSDEFGDISDRGSEFESLLGDKFNLVWKSLSKSAGSESVQFKELIMSVSGSIIGQKIDGAMHYNNLPSLVNSDHMVEKYIGNKNQGATVKLYVCDEGVKCLNPTSQTKTIPQKETLYGRVEKILDDLIDKVKKNDVHEVIMSDAENALITFSTIPLIPLIQQELARYGEASNIFLRNGEFLDVICYDIMTGFLEGLIQKSIKEVKSLEFAQVDNTITESFYKDARHSLEYLRNMKITAFKRLQIILQTKEKLISQEKEFEFLFSRLSVQGD